MSYFKIHFFYFVDATVDNQSRIEKLELEISSIRNELEELRPELRRLLILLNATNSLKPLPNEPKNKFNVIICDPDEPDSLANESSENNEK